MTLPELLQPILFTVGIAFAAASSLFIREGNQTQHKKDGDSK